MKHKHFIEVSNICPTITLKTYVETKLPRNVRFHIPQMKRSDLLAIICTHDVKKATGLDGITAKIFKSSAETVCQSLLKIVNKGIASGKFRNSLKLAKLIPVYKRGPQNDPSNYRPISILSILSKIIEKHITKHLFAYLSNLKYDLLHKCQSGFRKNHSCNTFLINLFDKWLKQFEKGNIIRAIFLYLR